VIRKPWPSMLRGIFNDPDRYVRNNIGAMCRACISPATAPAAMSDGYFWIMGRVDDVINVSGHRLGTAEIESALVSHPSVAEAAVVGMPHEMKGQGVAAFVTLRRGNRKPSDQLKKELIAWSPSRSAAWPSPIRFASPIRCPKPAAEKSCGAASLENEKS
jgi:acetyl-CoA synthetase